MEKIYGLTLEEFVLVAVRPANGLSESQKEAERIKGIRFGESVLGRELLNYLPLHKCEANCDSLTLSIAEMFAAKRPLNPKAFGLFSQRFHYYAKVLPPETTELMRAEDWRVNDFLRAWVTQFMARSLDVLHGELDAEELFGNGYLLETWQRLEEFLESSGSGVADE